MLTFGTVCDGIGCGHLAFNQAGFRCAWSFEIEAFPSAVLAYRFPEVKNWGDMNAAWGLLESGSIEAPDVFTGGTPCQAFSVAGKRGGLKDERGNLALEFCRIADAIDAVRQRDGKPPCAVLWENVPGVLSDKGNAFGCFLGELSGSGCELQPPGGRWRNAGCVFGPKRTVAWRTLDSQFFGVAQRRRRVFVVAGSGAFRPEEVLFEFDGLRRDSPPSREAGQGAAAGFEIGPAGGKRTDLSVTLDSRAKDGPIRNQVGMCVGTVTLSGADVSRALTARHDSSPCVDRGQEVVACHTTGAGWWQEGFGTLRGRPQDSHENVVIGEAFRMTAFGEYANDGTASTLKQRDYKDATDLAVAFEPRYFTRDNKTGGAASCGPTVAALSAQHAGGDSTPCVATYDMRGRGDGEVVNTLCTDHASRPSDYCPVACFSIQERASHPELNAGPGGKGFQEGVAYTLEARNNVQSVARPMQVRRLTPIETERLQALPDNWTMIPWRGKPAEDCPDGPRYKGVGNGQTVTVMKWLADRIRKGLDTL